MSTFDNTLTTQTRRIEKSLNKLRCIAAAAKTLGLKSLADDLLDVASECDDAQNKILEAKVNSLLNPSWSKK